MVTKKKETWADVGLDDPDLAELVFESERQIDKWGWQVRTPEEWLMYTTEELGELAEAISEYKYRKGRIEDVIKEAIQVATLALKISAMAEVVKDGQ